MDAVLQLVTRDTPHPAMTRGQYEAAHHTIRQFLHLHTKADALTIAADRLTFLTGSADAARTYRQRADRYRADARQAAETVGTLPEAVREAAIISLAERYKTHT